MHHHLSELAATASLRNLQRLDTAHQQQRKKSCTHFADAVADRLRHWRRMVAIWLQVLLRIVDVHHCAA
jgi:hypothetical protein